MKISVIIPCYNMVNYIEQTIKSVVSQEYLRLELIVIDGGSTDGTLEILEKYKQHFSHFISETDKGQYYAIEKGMNLATGDILCWLNADDVYFPWTLKTVATVFLEHPQINWLCGLPSFLNEDGKYLKLYNSISAKVRKAISNGWYRKNGFGFLQQESMFWRKDLYIASGGIEVKYKLAADYQLWTKFAEHAELVTLDLPLASFRLRANSRSKALEAQYNGEVDRICINKLPIPFYFRFLPYHMVVNRLIRLMVWKKTAVVLKPMFYNGFKFTSAYRNFSGQSLTQLLLELNRNK